MLGLDFVSFRLFEVDTTRDIRDSQTKPIEESSDLLHSFLR